MICRECKTTEGPFTGNPNHKNSGICKKCHAKYSRNKQKLAGAKRNPHRWFSCDDCEEVFNVRNKDKTLNTNCIYCGSEEILTFAEQMGI